MHNTAYMKGALLALFVTVPGLATLAGCSHPDPAAQFARAKAAYAAEDYGNARAAVLAGLENDPHNVPMLFLLVHADLALADGDGAGRALSRLASLVKPGPDMTDLAAEAALLRGDRGEMERLLGKADGKADGATAWRLRGEAALAAKDGAAALAAFKHAFTTSDYRLAADYARFELDDENIDEADRALAIMRKTGPDRLDTLMIAGMIAQHRGQFDAAQAAFESAAKRFPSRVEPLVALADLADLRGHGDETARYAAAARALNPMQPQVFSLTVRVAAEQGDWAKVRDLLSPREGALDLRGFDGMAYGEALLHLGHAEAARAIYQKALVLSPQNPFARLMLAQCDLAANDGAEALATIRPLADSVLATSRELDIAIAAATMAHDPAAATYTARRNSPQLATTNASAARAQAAMAERNWAAALTAYRAMPGYDRDAEVLKRMAAAATGLGQHDAAIGYADHALRLDPRNPDMVHMAGLTRLNAGRDLGSARSLLRQALDRDPANPLFRADFARTGG